MKANQMKPAVMPFFIIALIFSVIPSFGTQKIPEVVIEDPSLIDSTYNLYATGTLFLSGQPKQENFDEIKEKGVTLVINVRTAPEMRDHDAMLFNEKEYIESLGMAYLNAEVGGNAGFTPEVIGEIADAIFSTEGRVLIHCRSAARATLVWMAWLVRYQDYKIDDAIRLGKMAQFSFPFQDLLGFPLTMKKGR